MLTYNDLSARQKAVIDKMVRHEPSLATATTVNRQTIWKIFTELKDTPDKIGFPVFLTKANTISRGLYSWPTPSTIETIDNSQDVVYNGSVDESKQIEINQLNEIVESEHKEFYDEAIAAGVTSVSL